MRAPRFLPILIAFVAAAIPSVAGAQEDALETRFGLERFRLAGDRNGILDTESGDVSGSPSIGLALWMGYADDPLNVYRDGPIERERIGSLVNHRIGGELIATISLWDSVQLAIDAPLIFSQDQDGDLGGLEGPPSLSSFGLGDVRIAPKLQLVEARSAGFDLALILGFGVPSGSSEDYFGETDLTFAPELAASTKLADHLRTGVNLGFLVRERKEVLDLAVDDELFAHVGFGYMVHPMVELDATFHVATAPDDFFGAFNRNSSEVRGGAVVILGDLSVFAAAGAGTSEGFGTPDWRMLAGVRVGADLGLSASGDRGRIFASNLGEADSKKTPADSDGDGIPDADDSCPLVAEPLNGIADEDGCPDSQPTGTNENDADDDGVADASDKCPALAEDLDGFEDQDGCPDPDNDGDGVLDAQDACPNRKGTKAAKGCIGPDGDGDGIADSVDNCPADAGTEKNFGCADEQLVRLTGGTLEVLEKVYFLTDASTIRPRSYRLLRNVAAVLKAHPELKKVRIEGHTDDRGSESYNQSLSLRRAKAVRNFIVASGLDTSRLEAVGRGEAEPIAENTSAEGQAANRRVEFVLVGAARGTIEQRDTGPTDDTIER